MSDLFRPTPFADLVQWIFTDLEKRNTIFDIDRGLFFEPRTDDPFRLELQGTTIATPFGVAAGPHTQLAPGIIASWACGARVLELKTVQLRGVEVVRPCIRMRDEGLNVEWSQELEPEASFDQYLDAWVLIHALHLRLGWPGPDPETIFDISVGYDFEGLTSEPMRRYFSLVADAGAKLEERFEILTRLRPEFGNLEVPSRLSSRVTLSTLHGCPSGEIGRMISHLMNEYGLHAKVKLNPSLLGAAFVRSVLHDHLGFTDLEPDEAAFAEDLKLAEAVDLVAELQGDAQRAGVTFGVKLSNTLPLQHHGDAFPAGEKTMYLSSRPLHPLTVQIAAEFKRSCGSDLAISFCGGADAFNTPELLASGMAPVTTCSDLLRPGGIPRLRQYTDTTRDAMEREEASDLGFFALARARSTAFEGDDVTAAAHHNLENYAAEVLENPAYRRETYHRLGKRSTRPLGLFDCIKAPCISACGIDQDVPEYLRQVAAGNAAQAADVIRRDNPLPVILGRTCHHPCETDCLRTHYDEPLAIRDIKRFAMEHAHAPAERCAHRDVPPVAVIGGGPCGLGAAWELRKAGVPVTVFEADEETGGMVSATIPVYRAADEAVQLDLQALREAGIDMRHGRRFPMDFGLDDLDAQGFRAVVLAAGAARGRALGMEGEEAEGVWDGLEFLRCARRGDAPNLGQRVGIIGAGDVAMDCARTAVRLGAEVSVIYRRQAAHSPAHPEEMRALREEGVIFRELLAPYEIEVSTGSLTALRCQVMRPGAPGADGRPRPEAVEGQFSTVELDSLIVAIGQDADPATLAIEGLEITPNGWVKIDERTGRTSVECLWAGGDVVRGPSSIVSAAGDGRRIARNILAEFGVGKPGDETDKHRAPDARELARLMERRAERLKRVPTPELPPGEREGFAEVTRTFDETEARMEAARCLDCDILCSTCVTACPNRAFLTYEVEPFTVAWPKSISGTETFERTIDQPYQVAVINDWCNACGNCTEFCPTAGRPHEDKPRLVLDRQAFETFEDNAFHPRWRDGQLELLSRHRGTTHTLTWGENLNYTGPQFSATLDPMTTAALWIEPGLELPEDSDLDWSTCLALLTVGRGLLRSAPGLLAATRGELRPNLG
ncbi:MAG: FAD-dependent oxidoreductase [Thermoanaerobaculales bacterium]|nr:FAD-dependent oxidoreductase [Thermoanaerobaculales bacterium]